MDKERLRGIIAMQTAEYLARGGVIEQVPRVIFCPSSMDWARQRGWDYQPWSRHGDLDWFAGLEELEEGCYLTKPKRFED